MVVISNAQSSDDEGTMGVDVEVISSNDDEQMDADEGEVTEQQKKVAEAAGLGEQVRKLFFISFYQGCQVCDFSAKC